MEVIRLELTDFRNYGQVDIELAAGVNAVVGRNGQGKTNLLEAVYVLSSLASHRVSSSVPMIRHGTDRAVVAGSGEIRERQTRVDVELRSGAGVRARVNRVAMDRHRHDLAGFASVLFSPEDLQLAKGGPEERRRFLDHVSAGARPLAAVERLEFERVLRQRNGALKASQFNPRAASSLDVWDEQFARAGAVLVRNRLEVLTRLRPIAQSHYRVLVATSGGEKAPTMSYRASWVARDVEIDEEGSEEELMSQISLALAESRSREVERGTSLVGPQRDDLDLMLGNEEVRTFSSQGEQRTLALALRLGERDLVADARGESPILLLDDVFSELDDSRRAQLGDLISKGGQTIATATGADFLPVDPSRILTVDDGKVTDG